MRGNERYTSRESWAIDADIFVTFSSGIASLQREELSDRKTIGLDNTFFHPADHVE
jgi:hypothetical protein